MNGDSQLLAQGQAFEHRFNNGSRGLVDSTDPLVRYLTRWRIEKAWEILANHAPDLGTESSVLILCSGDGGEATVIADQGVRHIAVADLALSGVASSLKTDPRLNGIVCDATRTPFPDNSFDVVIVQDGLHHLSQPVAGFVEMMRVARRCAFFLEPHRSLVGRLIGTEWEENGDAINYVFRWDRHLVEQIANSYLGRDKFVNLSFPFWHHNVVMERLARKMSWLTVDRLAATKSISDSLGGRFGNQFCGMVVLDGAAGSV